MTTPITHGGADRCWKLCRCSECGREEVCTPSFDFYTRGDDGEGPLVCERCLTEPHQAEVGR